MQKVYVYDVEAERIDELCKRFDCSEAEVIEALFDAVNYAEEDLKDYLG